MSSTNATFPTPLSEVNTLLVDLVTGINAVLADNFIGFYLQGSFAIGDWDADSDVDFIVAVDHDVSDLHLSALQDMHSRIYDMSSTWAKHLEGSYFPKEALRRNDPTRSPLLFLDNTFRELIRSNHCNTLIVRWCVRERGITLAGPPPAELIDPVSADDLRQEVRETMHDWAQELFANPDQVGNRWFQPYAVLSYCRMLHTLHTGKIESKLAGVHWGKSALEPRWAGLIERAWQERPDPSLKVRQPADSRDVQSAFDFIRYALEVSGRFGVAQT